MERAVVPMNSFRSRLLSFGLAEQITALHLLYTRIITFLSNMSPAKDATREELHELGIFVHDYELYTASQMNYFIPILRYMPRYALGDESVGLAA